MKKRRPKPALSISYSDLFAESLSGKPAESYQAAAEQYQAGWFRCPHVLAHSRLCEWIHKYVMAVITIRHHERPIRQGAVISEGDVYQAVAGKRGIDRENVYAKTGSRD